MKYFGAIDPGKDGAIVIIDETGYKLFTKFCIPKIGTKEVDKIALSRILKQYSGLDIHFALERVASIPQSSAKSNFVFGNIYGFEEGLLVGHEIPYTLVPPKTWQKEMFDGVVKITKKRGNKETVDTKAMALVAARRLFPSYDLKKSDRARKPHDGVVDALLMAEYIRRKHMKK